MPHNIWHCGRNGEVAGQTPEYRWPSYNQYMYIWRIDADLSARALAKLERKLHKRADAMAEYARSFLGLRAPIVHEKLDGGFHCSSVGTTREGIVVVPPFDYGSSATFGRLFDSDPVTHPQASALDAWLRIEQYKNYLDVYELTGQEIYSTYVGPYSSSPHA